MIEGPKPTGKPPEEVTLTGKLFAWMASGLVTGQPVLFRIPGSDLFYLPVFSTEEKLLEVCARARADFDRIKLIDNGPVFFVAVPKDVRIILDPWFTAEGRLRFTEVRFAPAGDA